METFSKDALILSALLHDIGKFMQRADTPKKYSPDSDMGHNICPTWNGRPTHLHVLWTASFLDEARVKAQNMYKPDLSSLFEQAASPASRHHKPLDDRPEQVIIQAADCLSSGVDREARQKDESAEDSPSGQAWRKFRQTRLRSVLSEIQLPDNQKKSVSRYHDLAWLNPEDGETIHPSFEEEIDEGLPEKYQNLWTLFACEFDKLISGYRDTPSFLQALDSLLLHTTWCIPSSTVDQPNISLYDHSRTTAAIAAALFEYHAETETQGSSSIRNESEQKFLLLGGDLSGIQKFIFHLDASNSKEVAKILRARSFYLTALSLAVIRRIQIATQTSSFSVVHNAGGRFTLLLPNIERVRSTLSDLRVRLDEWLLGE